MVHDFNTRPELTNSQMNELYFESPHKQIVEDFTATVEKVHDGDTITLRTDFRDFDFPLRFLETNAPELNERGGEESKEWLKKLIEGEEIQIIMNADQRVGKYGRLLGRPFYRGLDIGQQSINTGHSTTFENRNEGKIPNITKEFNIRQWLT